MKALWHLSSEHLAKKRLPARCLRKQNRFSQVPAAYLKYSNYGWRCRCYDCASVLSAVSQNKQVSPVVVSLIWDVKTQRFAGLSSISQGSGHRHECSDLSLFRLPPSPGTIVMLDVLWELSRNVHIIVSGKHLGAAFLNDSPCKSTECMINVPYTGSLVCREKWKLVGLCELPWLSGDFSVTEHSSRKAVLR